MPFALNQLGRCSTLEGVPSALAAARDGVDAMLRDRGLRRTTPELTTESLLRGAAASARLEGATVTLEQLRAGEGSVRAVGAARLYAELLGLVPVVGRSPLQALARMHTLAASGITPAEELGRPRSDAGVARRLQSLCIALLQPTETPALAVAAMAHAEIATMEPFEFGSGLVARALERLVLVSRGVDPASVLVPEAGHALRQAEYEAALSAYRDEGLAGCRDWLLYAASALGDAVAASPLRPSSTR